MATKRIKDIATTATEADLVSGNYFAIDGSAGTKKLPAEAVALRSVQDLQHLYEISYDWETGGINSSGADTTRNDRRRTKGFIPVTAHIWNNFTKSTSGTQGRSTYSLYGYDADYNFISYTLDGTNRVSVSLNSQEVYPKLKEWIDSGWVYYRIVAIPNDASDMPTEPKANLSTYKPFDTILSENALALEASMNAAISDATNLVVSCVYDIGGITSSNGQENTRTDRFRIRGFLDVSEVVTCPVTTYGGIAIDFIGNFYDAEYNFISAGGSWTTLTGQIHYTNPPAGTKFIKILFRLHDGSTITDTIIGDLGNPACLSSVINEIDNLNSRINSIVIPDLTGDIERSPVYWDAEINIPAEVPIRTGIALGRSSTDGLQVWVFAQSNDEGTDTAKMYKCDFNPSTNTLSYVGSIDHNLGHCNSVSYNPNNDTLVLGNGSGDYSLEGKIYIVPNAKTRADMMLADILVIDFPKSDYGFKTNAVWGERDDIIYVLTNDSHTIYRVQLGLGSNDLGSGTLHVVSAGEFNGTFKILQQNNWGNVGRDYDNVVQGADFGCGVLFWGYGHSTGLISFRCGKMKADGVFDLHTYNQKYTGTDGTETAYTAEGMFTYNGCLYQMMSNKIIYKIPIQFLM